MVIRRVKAKSGSHYFPIYVSDCMENKCCDDGQSRTGYWWVPVGCTIAHFVTTRPRSCVNVDNLPDYDVFTASEPIRSKEIFASYLEDR